MQFLSKERGKTNTLILVLHCTVTSVFWQDFKNWLLKEEPTLTFDLSPSSVLWLTPQVFNTKHDSFLFSVARFYIWTSRTHGQCPRGGFPSFLSHRLSPFVIIISGFFPCLRNGQERTIVISWIGKHKRSWGKRSSCPMIIIWNLFLDAKTIFSFFSHDRTVSL